MRRSALLGLSVMLVAVLGGTTAGHPDPTSLAAPETWDCGFCLEGHPPEPTGHSIVPAIEVNMQPQHWWDTSTSWCYQHDEACGGFAFLGLPTEEAWELESRARNVFLLDAAEKRDLVARIDGVVDPVQGVLRFRTCAEEVAVPLAGVATD